MDTEEVVLDNPASPEELLFIEDKRPGNVIPAFPSPKSNDVSHKINQNFTEDFIKLDSEDLPIIENLKSDGLSKKSDVSSDVSSKPENIIEGIGEKDLCFVMEDRNPLLTGADTQSPKYKINESFLKSQDPKGLGKKDRFANPCFNCGETCHIIRDCPHPRNPRKIAQSRKEFMDSKSNVAVYRRYHKDQQQTCGKYMPGEISQELQHALGLEDRELPSYIYAMRLAGYPPGWLEEATVSHSGITMFDGQGREVQEPGVEEGENKSCQDKYDIRKIVRYPGFNVPPPPGTYDDYDYWRCPPFSKMQSVEAMIERLGDRLVGGYKRKKMSLNTTTSTDDSFHSTVSNDMEYEETPEHNELPEDNCKFIPPLPEEGLPPPPPLESPESPPPTIESPESPDSMPKETKAESPPSLSASTVEETSLIELEEKKKLLLAQLNDVSPLCGTPSSKIGKTKTIELGTPILQSVSPFSKLPSSDKFSVNICDVINFENLPDSTGKYEQMSGIIKKVRQTLKDYYD